MHRFVLNGGKVTSLIDEYPWHFQESTQTRKVYCEKVPKRSFLEEEEKCHECTLNMFRSLEPVCELMSIPDTCPEEEACKDEARLDPSITLHSGEENETKLLALILVCFPISTLTILLSDQVV